MSIVINYVFSSLKYLRVNVIYTNSLSNSMKLPFELNQLIGFLLKARLSGYAGSAPKVSPQRPGCKEFETFIEGDFSYRDSYAGYYCAPGQEIVWFKQKPIWMMAYSGGMLPEFHGNLEFTAKTFNFLQKALKSSNKKYPFRGSDHFDDGEFVYKNKTEGDITQFSGEEKILFKGKEVFFQKYVGGLVMPKEVEK